MAPPATRFSQTSQPPPKTRKFFNRMGFKKSKRTSVGKRLAIAKRVRDTYKKQQRVARKNKRNDIKVPRSYLLSDEQKEQLKRIKEETLARQEEYLSNRPKELPAHVADFEAQLQTADALIEAIDGRDVEGSRSADLEERVFAAGKRLFVFVNYVGHAESPALNYLLSRGAAVLTDVRALSGAARVCLFGQAKTGKFSLAKAIEAALPGLAVKMLDIPLSKITPSAVLRKAVPSDKIDTVFFFRQMFPFIDKGALADHYALPRFATPDEFLETLGSQSAPHSKKNAQMALAAKQFISDVQNNKIAWACDDSRMNFTFTRC